LRARATRRIEKQLGRIRKKAKGANMKHRKRLHRLRIEFKRLRYTCEFFKSLYPSRLKKFIRRLTELQDALGIVHDAHVQMRFMDCRRQSGDPALEGALERMIRVRTRQQHQAYQEFRQDSRAFESSRFRHRIEKSLRADAHK
jgi:CHAD domain-containing protein